MAKKRLIYLTSLIICYQHNLGYAKLPAVNHYAKAWHDLRAEKYQDAEESFKLAGQQFEPKDYWLAADGRAWVAYYRGDLAEAKRRFTQIVQNYPKAYLSHKGLGMIAQKEQDDQAAIRHFLKSFTINAKQPIYSYVAIMNTMLERELLWSTQQVLTIARKAYPDSGELLLIESKLRFQKGDKQGSNEKLIEAAALSPIAVDAQFARLPAVPKSVEKKALMNVAWGLYHQLDYPKAQQRFDEVLAIAPNELEALRGKAFSEFKLGQCLSAKENLLYLASNDVGLKTETDFFTSSEKKSVPIEYNAATLLAWCEYDEAQYDKAQAIFTEQLKTHPDWVSPKLGLGYIHKKRGDIVEYNALKKEVDKAVPGYWPDDNPKKNRPKENTLGVFASSTYGRYGDNSAKKSNWSNKIGVNWQNPYGFYIDGFFIYNNITFKSPTPKENYRLGYNAVLTVPKTSFSINLKGNYVFKSSYDSADNNFYPYIGAMLSSKDGRHVGEMGYAHGKFDDVNNSESNQFTIGYSQYFGEFDWFGKGMYYYNEVERLQEITKYSSGHLQLTRFFDNGQSLSLGGVFGKRAFVYDLNLNQIYDSGDEMRFSGGVTYNFSISDIDKMFIDISGERYRSKQTKQYDTLFLTIGANFNNIARF